MKPFIGSSKSADIIFVWWGKRLVTPFKIYMMIHQTISVWWHVIVILVSSRLEDDYTPAKWDKYIYNHEANLGDEDCTVIFGLADFCNMVTVTTGKQVSLCTLRKNTPTVPGMIRPKVIDPTANQNCTIITFNHQDRPYIESQKLLFRIIIMLDQCLPTLVKGVSSWEQYTREM